MCCYFSHILSSIDFYWTLYPCCGFQPLTQVKNWDDWTTFALKHTMEDYFLQLSLNLHALFLIFLDALVLTIAAIVANQHLHLLSVVRVEFPVKMIFNLMACLRSHATNVSSPSVWKREPTDNTWIFFASRVEVRGDHAHAHIKTAFKVSFCH